jgi:Putative phage tail protein
MNSIYQTKELQVIDSPILLFDCLLSDGTVEHWSTQSVSMASVQYRGRVGKHSLFEFQTALGQGVDSMPKVVIDLANADSHFSELERSSGFKGAKLIVSFVFMDLKLGNPTTDSIVVFQGIVNSPDLITETTFRLSAVNRLSSQRVFLPKIQIQRRCVWEFPATLDQRTEASTGGTDGRFSRFYSCGYSPDVPGGSGNLNNGVPFTSCGFTRTDCEARGMFNHDSSNRTTARFSGVEFVPSTITVRTAGESGTHLSPVSINEARYNDFVPLIYGTAWFQPEIVFARNDGNLTRMEVLLGTGRVSSVYKVLVNDIDIPAGQAGVNMTGTGWYNVVSFGDRTGAFNLDFSDSSNRPLGDPYGSMAFLSVVVPNRISNGTSLPNIQVLIDGIQVRTFQADGTFIADVFSRNPAWIIFDVLMRSGWKLDEIDISSFVRTAVYCDEQIQTVDPNGNPISVARFQCNLVLQARRSFGDVLRGIRNSSRLFFTFGPDGLLQVNVENTLALQQPTLPPGSNATNSYNDGWPAYEFGDGTGGLSGILRNPDGSSSLRLSSKTSSDSPNRFSVEFQDAFNEYQQDSFSIVDADDVARAGQEVAVTLNALGLPNYDQAARILKFNLLRSVQGNLIAEFQTSVKALGLFPGNIITITYLKEGFERQPFRILKIAPGSNYRTATITAQIHNDDWYSDDSGENGSGRRLASVGLGLPRPIAGTTADSDGTLQFAISESTAQQADGSATLMATVGYAVARSVSASAPGVPLVSLIANVQTTGGTVPGGQTLYYALSSVDGDGNEGSLSFVVRAFIPAGTDTNEVLLTDLSFPSAAVSFHVYRGPNPSELYRIASNVPSGDQFSDTGLANLAILPPDPNFDHANFYWRLELQSEIGATTQSATTIGNGTLQMAPNTYRGAIVRISKGGGAQQERAIVSNTATVLTIDSPWSILPDSSSSFVIAQTGFQFGATSNSTEVQFPIPDRPGAVIEISGRSANSHDVECPYELSPLTRWQIGGTGIGTSDTTVPAQPVFGVSLSTTQGGTIDLGPVGFPDLSETRTVSAGTYTFHYYDELGGPPAVSLQTGIGDSDQSLLLSASSMAEVDSFIQMEQEILQVTGISADELTLQVNRGMHGSPAAAHEAGSTLVYVLSNRVVTVPFIRNFFGTPASGNWTYSLPFPNVRIASAELFVTNSQGNSPIASGALTDNLDAGLRTLSGGQYSFQVAGFLAVQTGAAPDISVEGPHAIRDVFAIVKTPPTDAAIIINVNVNEVLLCSLTIPATAESSEAVSGLLLPALRTDDRLSMDLISVGQTIPGSDLTVVIRV